MKYISVLVFAILLSVTWIVLHSEQAISFETHAGIQEKLAQLIQQTILNKKPNATDIRIRSIWTEPQGKDEVEAHFVYSFQEPDENGKMISTQIQGQGILKRQADDGSGLDRWTLNHVQATSDAVVFEEGLVVTPGDEPSSPDSALTQPPGAQPAGAQPGETATPAPTESH